MYDSTTPLCLHSYCSSDRGAVTLFSDAWNNFNYEDASLPSSSLRCHFPSLQLSDMHMHTCEELISNPVSRINGREMCSLGEIYLGKSGFPNPQPQFLKTEICCCIARKCTDGAGEWDHILCGKFEIIQYHHFLVLYISSLLQFRGRHCTTSI